MTTPTNEELLQLCDYILRYGVDNCSDFWIYDVANALIDRLEQEQINKVSPSVTFGWKLVPIEPTHDDEWMLLVLMCELHANVPEESRPVGWASFSEAQRERIRAAYKAMLNAAPTPAIQETL